MKVLIDNFSLILSKPLNLVFCKLDSISIRLFTSAVNLNLNNYLIYFIENKIFRFNKRKIDRLDIKPNTSRFKFLI